MKLNIAASLLALALSTGHVMAQDATAEAFGSEEDVKYAELIWEVMAAERLAGPGMLMTVPYEGTNPHGTLLETYFTRATIDGYEGDLVVKRNYGAKDIDADKVLSDPQKYLGAYTVMFRREAGYDPDNGDWFWIRYKKDGSISRTKKDGPFMAGRLAERCSDCHQGAGDDLIFTSDHLLQE